MGNVRHTYQVSRLADQVSRLVFVVLASFLLLVDAGSTGLAAVPEECGAESADAAGNVVLPVVGPSTGDAELDQLMARTNATFIATHEREVCQIVDRYFTALQNLDEKTLKQLASGEMLAGLERIEEENGSLSQAITKHSQAPDEWEIMCWGCSSNWINTLTCEVLVGMRRSNWPRDDVRMYTLTDRGRDVQSLQISAVDYVSHATSPVVLQHGAKCTDAHGHILEQE